MRRTEFYNALAGEMDFPAAEWDNDGVMCLPNADTQVRRVLCTLDVTEAVVEYAVSEGFDLILSHHPLLFSAVKAVTPWNPTSAMLLKLIKADIAVFSFHTRADKACGGVNDRLAELLGIENALPFGEGELGRVGEVEEMTLEDFIYKVKTALGADVVKYSDGYNTVKRVALVGGDGKDFVSDAIKCGADTYLSGRISYNLMEEAAELGINLIEAGHYHTEVLVLDFLAELLNTYDMSLTVDFADSNMIEII